MKKVGQGLRLLEKMQIVGKKDFEIYHINAISSTPTPDTTTALLIDEYKDFADTFNTKVKYTAIPQIRGLSDTRKRALVSRAKEYGGLKELEAVIDRVVASDFLSGRKTDFCASFDWIFKKANFIKIIEGNYDNKLTPTATDRYASEREANRQRVDNGLRAAMDVVARENGF